RHRSRPAPPRGALPPLARRTRLLVLRGPRLADPRVLRRRPGRLLVQPARDRDDVTVGIGEVRRLLVPAPLLARAELARADASEPVDRLVEILDPHIEVRGRGVPVQLDRLGTGDLCVDVAAAEAEAVLSRNHELRVLARPLDVRRPTEDFSIEGIRAVDVGDGED